MVKSLSRKNADILHLIGILSFSYYLFDKLQCQDDDGNKQGFQKNGWITLENKILEKLEIKTNFVKLLLKYCTFPPT